jgi:hypothetical protein
MYILMPSGEPAWASSTDAGAMTEQILVSTSATGTEETEVFQHFAWPSHIGTTIEGKLQRLVYSTAIFVSGYVYTCQWDINNELHGTESCLRS